MRRLLVLSTAVAASAWASAQGPLASDRAKLFTRNHVLVERLVGHTVTLANAPSGVPRAAACRDTAAELAFAFGAAAKAEDADRVAELGEYLTAVLTDGLLPSLHAAKTEVTPNSPQEAELRQVHGRATTDLSAAVGGLPADGKLAQSRRVAAVKKQLEAAAGELAKW